MARHCTCGREITQPSHGLACLECGAACCPGCAIDFESVSYCAACAGKLLGTVPARSDDPFELSG